MYTANREYIKRFGPARIIEHWLNAGTFVLLVVTGLAQKFYDYEISQWVIMTFGGIDTTRLVHRYSGIALAILTVQHILVASYNFV